MKWFRRWLSANAFGNGAPKLELALAGGAMDEDADVVEEKLTAEAAALRTLTRREREVFELIVQGKMLKEVAYILGVKYSTANTHYTNMYRKLGVQSRSECILRYYLAR